MGLMARCERCHGPAKTYGDKIVCSTLGCVPGPPKEVAIFAGDEFIGEISFDDSELIAEWLRQNCPIPELVELFDFRSYRKVNHPEHGITEEGGSLSGIRRVN